MVLLNPLPTGMVNIETQWFYAGLVLPPDTNGDGIPDPLTDTFYQCWLPPCGVSPVPTVFCPVPVVVTYWPIGIPTGQEVDFGSPDVEGTAVQDTGWWPAVLFHDYEEKGVHPIHHRIYWKGWALGFYLLLGAPVWFFFGGTEVVAISEQTIDYQVDESRGTLEF